MSLTLAKRLRELASRLESDDTHEEIDGDAALCLEAAAALSGVPQGYALVPVEPTAKMVAAGGDAADKWASMGASDYDEARAVYKAMLQAHSAPASNAGDTDFRGEWIAVSERLPDEPHGMLLVTNNIDARDAHGFMSHLWLVRMIHYNELRGYYAFDDYDNIRPVDITHWRYALAASEKGAG